MYYSHVGEYLSYSHLRLVWFGLVLELCRLITLVCFLGGKTHHLSFICACLSRRENQHSALHQEHIALLLYSVPCLLLENWRHCNPMFSFCDCYLVSKPVSSCFFCICLATIPFSWQNYLPSWLLLVFSWAALHFAMSSLLHIFTLLNLHHFAPQFTKPSF